MLNILSITTATVVFFCAHALQAKDKADHIIATQDPPGQLFRYAPMPKATRSIIIQLGAIQFAFDTENLRTHTVWKGKLNLYGPQYVNAKRPFIAQPSGQVLWSNPPELPWRTQPPGKEPADEGTKITGKFIATATNKQVVTLVCELQLLDSKRVKVQLQPSASLTGIQRKFTISPCSQPLWLLAHSQRETASKLTVSISGSGAKLTKPITVPSKHTETIITEAGTETAYKSITTEMIALQHWVHVPSHNDSLTFKISTHHESVAPSRPAPAPPPLGKLGRSGQASFKQRNAPSNPHYITEQLILPDDLDLLITGMDWLKDGRLAVCTWPGEVYLLDGLLRKKEVIRFQRLAKGLNEPMGLLVQNDKLYLSQKSELTEIEFDEQTGETTFNRISADWGYSGHYNAFSYGPTLDRDGNFVLANAGHSGRWDMKFMGWAIRKGNEGKMQGIASGFREPNGIGTFGANRDIFVTDNQGQWTAACKLNHLQAGKYYGHPSAAPAPKQLYGGRSDFTPPAVWFPYTLTRSASGMTEIPDDRFGPFKGQLLVGDFQNALVTRVFLEKVNGDYQGAVFPFLNAFRSGVNRLIFGPDGNLYVGGLQRTWASIAPDSASFERVLFSGKTPFSIAKVEVQPNGFLLTFTKPIRPTSADPANFDVSQFHYAYHASYGSPRYSLSGQNGTQTSIDVKAVELSSNAMKLNLIIDDLKEGNIAEIRCFDIFGTDGNELDQTTLHYTLNQIPNR
jgi:hypothetical protein